MSGANMWRGGGCSCFYNFINGVLLFLIPSPSSPRNDKNSIPAFSNALRMAFAVLVRESTTPCSNRIMEFSETTARSANC